MRVYRFLLRLFPRDYREEHGTALEGLFADTLRDWRDEHGRTGARFWAGTAWDVARAATAEWRSRVERPGRARTAGDRMSSLMGDLRFALRQIARQPGHGVTVIVLMALGIAGNAAVFRVVEGLFLKPLPFEEAERLVDLDETAPQWNLEFTGIAYPDFVAWRERNSSFESMALFHERGANLSDGASAERVGMVAATHDLDDVLRIEPELGRFFDASEDAPNGARVALLTHGYWEERYASDPAVLGRTLTLDGQSFEVIGVLPTAADFVAESDLWVPLREDADAATGWYLSGIGRLRGDVTMERAQEDLTTVHRAMIEDGRTVNEIASPILHTLRDRYLGTYRASSWFLLGAVGIVLIIACANIAGLMFARSLARGSEIAVRLAMGAPRARIVRQLLVESLVLATAGAVVGVALGVWSSGLLVERLTQQFPAWVVFELDARFLTFTLVLTAGATLLFGLAPALHAASQPAAALAGATRSTGSRRRRRILSSLVVGEVALAVMLLVVGGLTVVDAHRLSRIDPGYAVESVATYNLQLPAAGYPDEDAAVAFIDAYVERLSGIAGVRGAAIASSLPLLGHWGWFFEVEGAPPRAEDESNPVVLMQSVTSGYFETMGVEIARGRALNAFDGRDDEQRVAIVNETFVSTFMDDGRDPIGRRINTGGDDPWLTIVGVARDVRHYGLDEPVRPSVYQPVGQVALWSFRVALRTEPGAASPLPAARSVTTELDPDLPLYQERTMSSVVDDSLWARRATSWVIAAFSLVAVLLAVAGLYGVISYSVRQRSREIGLRIAMGAQAGQVRGEVVRQGLVVVLVGVLIGAVSTLAMGRMVGQLLSQVEPTDPTVYASVVTLLVLVAVIANWLPARRASATDPMAVLRAD